YHGRGPCSIARSEGYSGGLGGRSSVVSGTSVALAAAGATPRQIIKTTYMAAPGLATLTRLVAGQRNAMHDPAEAVIVVDRIVHGAAVIPEGERADPPLEAAGELGSGLVIPEEFEQRQALLLRPALDVRRVRHRCVERLASRLGVRAHDWMLGRQFPGRRSRARLLHRILASLGDFGLDRK